MSFAVRKQLVNRAHNLAIACRFEIPAGLLGG
jgi:hypothetical protein